MPTSEAIPSESRLDELRVVDAMHPGLISCAPDATLQTVARMMASYGVHAVLVHGPADDADRKPWGIVSDWQVIQAAARGDVHRMLARDVAASPAVFVSTAEPLTEALLVMAETGSSHVVAVERHTQRPMGVLSTLDVVRALAELT